jgi:hypothetical protein
VGATGNTDTKAYTFFKKTLYTNQKLDQIKEEFVVYASARESRSAEN